MVVGHHKFAIVGIGASAGGLPAMEGLFKGVPDRPGCAFVIVTHLTPERHSLLDKIVARYTHLPVVVAKDDQQVMPNCVYVMPQNVVLTIEQGRLKLQLSNSPRRERKPIDVFFSSLAEDQGEYAVSVILSGGDGDGTLGAKVVKERGGLTIAQTSDGSGPHNPEMPDSAIASGVIDIAVPAEEIGEKLIAFIHSFGTLDTISEDTGEEGNVEAVRAEIYDLLRSHTGHDFSGYKTKTFVRRVKRRMALVQANTYQAYVGLLRNEAAEVQNLFRDLLINVTNFFRDTEAFAVLESMVIPKLFENRQRGDTVRAWVPGCATGEEVYSLAILMREYMDTLSQPPRVQIFATDIDDPALAVARAGRYPEPLLDALTRERRERFFTADGSTFVISNVVRELCIFSPHSVIRDPPFSRMDLVSCRNLLIYLGPEIQRRVIPTFHYSLKTGGYLFLGTSESISQYSDLFATVDKKNRIFQSREHLAASSRVPILVGQSRLGRNGVLEKGVPAAPSYSLRQVVETHIMERFVPAHVVVNAEGEVVYYSARTGKYLEPAQGAPSRQILAMARPGLRLNLRAALSEAATTRATTVRENVNVDEDGDRIQSLRLTVEPLADRGTGETYFLVLFDPVGPNRRRTGAGQPSRDDDAADLERELRETRERLQAIIEEYETALEELKSANEELVSVNEEAQSANEELEASKEEMQSLNEELNTINAELSAKIDELDHVNGDLKNLLDSTQIATVFLDHNLVIRNFTPAASAIFNLRGADVGRPLTDLATRLDYPELKDHIAAVFRTGEAAEHQLPRDDKGKHFLVRLIPYRSGAARIEGVVVTLMDVTTLAVAEAHQHVLISELNHRVKNMLAVVISIANHTLESAESPGAFTAALVGRLHAMSRAYGLLSRANWTDVSVHQLVSEEIVAFDAARFEISGPDLHLPPREGLSIGMVTHELATNASKYGALSAPGGRVSITWDHVDGQFQMDWVERGGAPVVAPEKDGFGLTLLKGEISYRLGGEVTTAFEPGGLQVRIGFQLDH